jgi:hypothetical protein
VLRPAPSIGELRSGSPRLVELNDLLRQLHKKGVVEVLSFCEVVDLFYYTNESLSLDLYHYMTLFE